MPEEKPARQRTGLAGRARRREQWQRYQDKIAPSRLVFIDETCAKTNMTRTYGRRRR